VWFGLLALCVLLSALRASPDLWFSSDDAWISYRYSWNLVHGSGLTWNPGLQPVEGYSNLLWTLWAAVGISLGAPVLGWCKASGVILTAGTVISAAGCVRAVGGSRPTAIAAAFLTACSTVVVLWGVSGMESPLMCLLLTAGTWRALAEDRAARQGGRLRAWSLLLFGLVAVTRVEGPIYLCIPVVIRLLRIRIQPLGRRDAWHLLLLCAPAIGQFAFRLAYYGEWLSNTYVVKGGGGPSSFADVRSVRYLLAGLTVNPWLGVLWLGGGALALWHRRGALLLPAAVCTVFILRVGGDQFAHLRFFAPVAPTMVAAGLVGLELTRRRLARTRLDIPILAGLVVLVLGAAQLDYRIHRIQPLLDPGGKELSGLSRLARFAPPYSAVHMATPESHNLLEMLRNQPGGGEPDWYLAYLMQNVPAGESFVFMDVGMVGYVMVDASLLDGRGLNWAPMAHALNAILPAGPSALEDPVATALLEDFHQQRPAVLCLQNHGARLFGPLEALLMADGTLERDYEFVARGTYWGMEDRVAIYRRTGLARVDEAVIQARYEHMARVVPAPGNESERVKARQQSGFKRQPEAPHLGKDEPRLLPAGAYYPAARFPPRGIGPI